MRSPRSPAMGSDGAESDVYAPSPKSPLPELDMMSPRLTTPSKRKRDNDPQPSRVDEKRQRRDAMAKFQDAFALDRRLHTWQLVFSHLSPLMLARLVRVSRMFRLCLTASTSDVDLYNKQGLLLQSGETVWTSSRRTVHPDMPEPLPDCTELRLWKSLLMGSICTGCEESEEALSEIERDATIIWPFAARLCRRCILHRTMDVS